MRALLAQVVVIAGVMLAACAPLEIAPPRPPEVRTVTVAVPTPVPVPCFTEAERPRLPPPTPIDIDHATVDQLAKAIAADDLAEAVFTAAVDALFIKCMKGTTP